MGILPRLLTSAGSIVSIGFGIWHFFVPGIWDWYSYIDTEATELVLAVRAINSFFSLTLVLLGLANLISIYRKPSDQFSIIILLSISGTLWITRVILQISRPQGSEIPFIQYGMLITFILVAFCYVISLFLILVQ